MPTLELERTPTDPRVDSAKRRQNDDGRKGDSYGAAHKGPLCGLCPTLFRLFVKLL